MLGARSFVTSQVHEAFLRAISAPAGHRLNVFLRRRAPADLSIACPLSCKRSMGHVLAAHSCRKYSSSIQEPDTTYVVQHTTTKGIFTLLIIVLYCRRTVHNYTTGVFREFHSLDSLNRVIRQISLIFSSFSEMSGVSCLWWSYS